MAVADWGFHEGVRQMVWESGNRIPAVSAVGACVSVESLVGYAIFTNLRQIRTFLNMCAINLSSDAKRAFLIHFHSLSS